MKSTESIDETAASAGRSLADGEAVSPSQTSLMDQRRRRLVRGAMAAAPLVLTLRSGALAAASCTGTKLASAYVRNNGGGDNRGKIVISSGNNTATTGLIAGSTDTFPPPPGETPDYCFINTNACPGNPGHVETIDANDNYAVVKRFVKSDGNTTAAFQCGSGKQFQGQTIAILSSASAASLIQSG